MIFLSFPVQQELFKFRVLYNELHFPVSASLQKMFSDCELLKFDLIRLRHVA